MVVRYHSHEFTNFFGLDGEMDSADFSDFVGAIGEMNAFIYQISHPPVVQKDRNYLIVNQWR